jgi:hypothetical protein
MLREELQLLQEPGSYVGEVVKVMGKSKVLVKVIFSYSTVRTSYGYHLMLKSIYSSCYIKQSLNKILPVLSHLGLHARRVLCCLHLAPINELMGTCLCLKISSAVQIVTFVSLQRTNIHP